MLDHLLPLALFVFLVIACVNSPSRTGNSPLPRGASSSPSGTAQPAKGSQWHYSEYTDEMGRGKIYLTSVVSSNTISLDFPYQGEQHGTLSVRDHPQHGKDVFLSIEKGQLLDSEYHSKVLVRFDEDRPQSFSSVRPADLSSDTLFLRGSAFPVFLNRLKTAKTLRIEVPVYQAGNQILEFDVEGFTWKK